jgi:Kef-type K+ transport system membrane component KefB
VKYVRRTATSSTSDVMKFDAITSPYGEVELVIFEATYKVRFLVVSCEASAQSVSTGKYLSRVFLHSCTRLDKIVMANAFVIAIVTFVIFATIVITPGVIRWYRHKRKITVRPIITPTARAKFRLQTREVGQGRRAHG